MTKRVTAKTSSNLTLFAKGRNLRMSLVLVMVMTAICFRWWYMSVDTHVLNQVEPVWVGTANSVPSLFVVAMVCCCAPRMPLTDRLGNRRPAAYGTLAVAAVCVMAMAVMPVVYGVYSVLPRDWIPGMDMVDATGVMLFREFNMFASGAALMRAVQAGFFGAVAAMATALNGRIVGTGLSLAVMLGELLLGSADSYGEMSVFTFTVKALPAWCVTVGILLMLSWVVWYLTAAGAPLLVLHHGERE